MTNSGRKNPFPKPCRKEKAAGVSYFTEDFSPEAYTSAMVQRTEPLLDLDPQRDIGTDYILIATGVGAALIALVYLLLT